MEGESTASPLLWKFDMRKDFESFWFLGNVLTPCGLYIYIFVKLKTSKNSSLLVLLFFFFSPFVSENVVSVWCLHPLRSLFVLTVLLPLTHPRKQLDKPGTLECLPAHRAKGFPCNSPLLFRARTWSIANSPHKLNNATSCFPGNIWKRRRKTFMQAEVLDKMN